MFSVFVFIDVHRPLVPLWACMWSKVLPLTASYLSPLPGLESQLEQVRKLPVTWG